MSFMLCCPNPVVNALPLTDLVYGLCDGYTKSDAEIEYRNADLDFCNLALEVPGCEALAKKFHIIHLGFNAALTVVTDPLNLNGATQMSQCIDGLVPSHCACARGLPRFGVLAGQDDGMRPTHCSRVTALADVIGTVSGH